MVDRLRWYRRRKGLLRRDMADFAGIDRSTYIHYEEAGRDYYPVEKLQKIAQIPEADMVVLMDGYNLFLYRGQGRQIGKKRQALGMSLSQYACTLGIRKEKLVRRENNQVQISKAIWERYFR